MSPTLLEGAIVLVLIVVAWQIGVQVTPGLMRSLKRANDQLNESRDEILEEISSSSSSSSLPTSTNPPSLTNPSVDQKPIGK